MRIIPMGGRQYDAPFKKSVARASWRGPARAAWGRLSADQRRPIEHAGQPAWCAIIDHAPRIVGDLKHGRDMFFGEVISDRC